MTETHRAAPAGQLSIDQTRRDGGVRVLTLRGEIDHTVKAQLTDALLPDDHTTPMRIVLDLSGVTFMDSSGINALVTTHQATTRTQGWLRLAAPQEAVQRVLHVVGLDDVIDCHPTLEQALTS
ncbi:STAS domain-containing protein [Streptomyces tauricus]|uniref:STAS domain-containing protein n=1 Tax=Streptomyces sp. LRE541 TaxID=2931983 RepID=UPI00200D7CE0|nr:STAS domain-containing protein [Streptomyces sp. LRE541]UPZ33710.1 STAS domain-containing protein [Streptomyces sp. LRE541]